MISHWRLWRIPGIIVVLLTSGWSQPGKAVTFFDDFAGPTVSANWVGAYPDATFGTGFGPIAYQGIPNHSFQVLDGSTVLRMSNVLSMRQRNGWTSSTTFPSSEFRYEARFNTLNQVAGVSIDGFMELSILDASVPTRIDSVNLFGSSNSTNRLFNADTNIDSSSVSFVMNYQSNTWYRLVIEGAAAENIRGYVTSDDGTELFGTTFSHTTSSFPAGVKLGLSQWMGLAVNAPVDVAVDWVSYQAVPEPSTFSIVCVGGLICAFRPIRNADTNSPGTDVRPSV